MARGRCVGLAALALAVLTTLAPAARAQDSFVRRLAERALSRGIAQEARGDIAQALTSYDEAVRTDTTLGAAALRLGGLRERMGDREEAELLYARAIAANDTAGEASDTTLGAAALRLGGLRERMGDREEAELLYARAIAANDTAGEAYYARALLRDKAGRRREALIDLSESVARAPTPERLRLLGGWYVEARLWPAALAVWRALSSSAEASGNAAELREARLTVAALSWLAADTDPVLAGAASSDWARRSLSRLARPPKREAQGVRKLTP